MGFEPIVECRGCDEPLEVYQDYESRFCECCDELRKIVETCADCKKLKTGIDGNWVETKYEDKWQCFDCGAKEQADRDRGDAMASLAEDQSIKAASYLMDAINGRSGDPAGRAALREILQGAAEKQD